MAGGIVKVRQAGTGACARQQARGSLPTEPPGTGPWTEHPGKALPEILLSLVAMG